MSEFNFEIGVPPYINVISNSQTNFQASAVIVGTANSWIAEKIVFNQDTTVNRLGVTFGVRPTGTPVHIVGITTSLGPNGQFPYTIDGIVGSAASLGFSKSIITTRNTQLEQIFEFALDSNFTFLKNVPYFLCIQNYTRNTGSNTFWGAPVTCGLNRANMGLLNTYLGFGVSFDITTGHNFIVAGYDSGLGNTIWYPQGHYVTDDSFTSASATGLTHRYTSFFEFGARLELNDLNFQYLNLRYLKYSNIFPIDSNDQYTCKLYDHRYNEVGIAITEKAIFASGAANDRGSFTFYFVPKIKISTDYPYYIGISATGGTATSATHRVLTRTGGETMRTQNNHYFDYVFRTSSGSAFTQNFLASGANQRYYPGILLGVSASSTNAMRRNNGN